MSTEQPRGRQNGAAIRVIRKLQRLSTADLAEAVGLGEQSLRNIENGSRPASDEVIFALARTLGVPVGAITRDGEALAA